MDPVATALRVFAASGLTALLRPLQRDAGVVFMLHRFSDPGRGVVGHDPAHVRRVLAYLRRTGYHLTSLEGMLHSAASGSPVPNAVAFTMDDGYAEQATVAGPLFAEFDCPVTTFVATGFLDGWVWFWWDKIEYVLRQASVPDLAFEGAIGPVSYRLDDAGRRLALAEITGQCKALPDPSIHELIERLAAAAQVTLPRQAPPEYTPMTWDHVRECERRGMTFGPHTVTHPTLSRVEDRRAEVEIRASWARLKSEAAAPLAVFAYPNGVTGDWSEREHAVLRQEGLRAVTAEPGFVTAQGYGSASGPLLIPRFAFPDTYPYFVQIVGGLERLKMLLRRSAAT